MPFWLVYFVRQTYRSLFTIIYNYIIRTRSCQNQILIWDVCIFIFLLSSLNSNVFQSIVRTLVAAGKKSATQVGDVCVAAVVVAVLLRYPSEKPKSFCSSCTMMTLSSNRRVSLMPTSRHIQDSNFSRTEETRMSATKRILDVGLLVLRWRRV